jgi:hypothetical protein
MGHMKDLDIRVRNGMAFDHVMVCDQCRSAWQFLRSRAGEVVVDQSLVGRPADVLQWIGQHSPHGIRVTDDNDIVVSNYENADIPFADRS